jgi:hypothetical protein
MLRGSGEFLLPLIQNHELAQCFERAIDRRSQLSYDEQVQATYLLTQLFRNWESAFYQYRQGTLEPWLWEAWRQVILSYFHQPGVQDWWQLRRSAYSTPLQDFLESSSRPDVPLDTQNKRRSTSSAVAKADQLGDTFNRMPKTSSPAVYPNALCCLG